MNALKLLVAAAAVAVLVAAFRDLDGRRWLAPALPSGGGAPGPGDDEEPFLGYDGMDVDTFLDWLEQSRADAATLRRIRDYEAAGRAREGILVELEARLRR